MISAERERVTPQVISKVSIRTFGNASGSRHRNYVAEGSENYVSSTDQSIIRVGNYL